MKKTQDVYSLQRGKFARQWKDNTCSIFKKNIILQWFSETLSVCLAVCLEKPMNLDKDSLRHRRFNYVNDAD